jgi:outer membrane lipoprotein-sorting protein
MSSLSRPVRWLAPLVAVGVIGAGVAVPRLADASDDLADLPPRTAAELLDLVAAADVDGLSGTVVMTSRLGLPELPSGGGGGSAVSLPGLLGGSTTARVWKAGEDRSRIAVDAPFSEYDVVRSGRDVWTYDSASSDVTHLVLPEGGGKTPAESAPPLPQDAAEQLLSFVEPTTEVTVGTAAVVADRAAYELVLDPRDPGTLVDTVRLAVDARTSVPLRVQVFGAGQVEPAIEIGFTSVRFEVPDASVFAFTPPPGSTVTEKQLPAREPLRGQRYEPEAAQRGTAPTVLGEGWTRVVVLDGVELPEEAAAMVAQLSTPVEGGRVVTSALVSVLLLDDGRVLVGPVPAERLVELAG